MQISATLVKGKARVQFGANKVRSQALRLLASKPKRVRPLAPLPSGPGGQGCGQKVPQVSRALCRGTRSLAGSCGGWGRRAAARRVHGRLLLQSQYSLTRAQQSYKSLVQIHEKNGELQPGPEDGTSHHRARIPSLGF